MHLHTGPKPGRKAPIGPRLLLALAVAAVGLSLAGEALAVDRWKHPPGRAGAGQFRAFRVGPNASAPNLIRPNAANSRADAVAGPEQRREGIGNNPAEARPPLPRRKVGAIAP
jgi:hypothetical protein